MFPINLGALGLPEQKDNHELFCKYLGWDEFDPEGDKRPACVVVMNANLGFTVFRFGNDSHFHGWYGNREEAIEAAVDLARMEIASHEIRQSNRD